VTCVWLGDAQQVAELKEGAAGRAGVVLSQLLEPSATSAARPLARCATCSPPQPRSCCSCRRVGCRTYGAE
jgi:hypothetical protein